MTVSNAKRPLGQHAVTGRSRLLADAQLFRANGSSRPILLKNSVSADDGKNPAPVGCDGRGKLGAYREELMSRCRAYSSLQQRTMDQILDQIRI